MTISPPATPFAWSELPTEDILLRLEQLRAQNSPPETAFLDTHQWCRLADSEGIVLAGGHESAQYRRAALEPEKPAVAGYRLTLDQLPEGIRSPRQLRAWLLRHGVAEGTIGDVIIGDFAWLAAIPGALDVAPLMASHVSGNVAPPALAEQRVTAASSRLDAVVGALFHVSRGEAQTAIEYDFVFHNFRPVTKPSQHVRPADQIVYRTKGRAEVMQLETNARSGRLWVAYRLASC